MKSKLKSIPKFREKTAGVASKKKTISSFAKSYVYELNVIFYVLTNVKLTLPFVGNLIVLSKNKVLNRLFI